MKRFLLRIHSSACVLAALVAAVPRGLSLAPSGNAPAAQEAGTQPDEAKTSDAKVEEEKPVLTHHSTAIGGEKIDYTASAARLALKDEDGKKKADVFYVAYTRDGVEDLAQRPITFSFNGGPGSSSVWLHLGTIGPRRVLMSDDGLSAKPPYALVDNAESWLDLTDLVFIDPVTTGYSRAAIGESDDQFHGVTEDVESVGEFIRLYTTREKRWGSPKFLAGESYGTTRAAGLSGHLQDRHGMYLNGIVLVSAILDFQTAEFDRGNDLPFVLFLPTYTATAWYHKRLAPDLQRDLHATLREVESFALREYAETLMKGDRLTEQERQSLLARLSRYTGLTPQYIEATNLRIQDDRFTKELLRTERRTVGRLDSRFRGIDFDAAGERYEYDPSYSGIQGPFTGALNAYVREELGYESDLPYEILTGRVRPWNYGGAENRYLNVAETLRKAMTKNPHLQVFVAAGYYDLATPYFAAEYTFDHLGLDASLRNHLRVRTYEAGHMMYIDRASRERLKQDVAEFLRASR